MRFLFYWLTLLSTNLNSWIAALNTLRPLSICLQIIYVQPFQLTRWEIDCTFFSGNSGSAGAEGLSLDGALDIPAPGLFTDGASSDGSGMSKLGRPGYETHKQQYEYRSNTYLTGSRHRASYSLGSGNSFVYFRVKFYLSSFVCRFKLEKILESV